MSGHSPDEIYQRIRDCFETGLDWETRTLYIIGELEDEKVHRYAALFQILDSTPGPITVTIISNGGFEQVGFALYDIIKAAKNTVTTIGYGIVYSIAAIILQAGKYRFLSPECSFMIHNGRIHLEGDHKTSDVIILADEARTNNGRYHDILSRHNGQSLEAIRHYCETEKYFTAKEAVQAGFADVVMTIEEKRK